MPYTLKIGDSTMFHTWNKDPHIIDFGRVNTNIVFGNYTMTGPNLTIFAGASEHHFKSVAITQEAYSDGDIRIGNGVWIGYSVTIFTGVTIGDGAVIGACSVVSKDVPPYAVVAGNPIRILKYRFTPEIIEKLLKIAWWDRGSKFIDDNRDLLFNDEKVDLFIKRCGL